MAFGLLRDRRPRPSPPARPWANANFGDVLPLRTLVGHAPPADTQRRPGVGQNDEVAGARDAGHSWSARAKQWVEERPDQLAIAVLAIVYLATVLPYSLLTPAWEPNDELYHAMYIEHILAHGSFPRIGIANGIESHQPPLYYLLAAGWQLLLRIPVFTPSASPVPGAPPRLAPGPFLTYSHHYTPAQHITAIYVHELRLLSVVLGLLTVVFSYGTARLVLALPRSALAAGLTVALLPKQLVVDSALTNDSLVITLCTLALFVFLWAEKARRQHQFARRRWLIAALGVTLGLAAVSKFNSLPLAVALLALSAVPALWPGAAEGRARPALRVRFAVDALVAGAAFLVVAAWWFIRNRELYGQFLASRATESYLRQWGYGLVSPVPWDSIARFVHFVPSHLYHSLWYDGSGNQWLLPNWMNNILWVLAGASALSAFGAVLARRRRRANLAPGGPLAGAAVAGALVAGLAAVLVIAQTTTQAEGRIAFVGLSAFAIILVLGTDLAPEGRWLSWAGPGLWPAVLVLVNVYVLATYVVPLGGL